MFSLMYVWWIFFHQLGKYHWPTNTLFSISNEHKLGMEPRPILISDGKWNRLYRRPAQNPCIPTHQKRNNQYLWNPPKTSTQYPICTHLNPSNPTTNLRGGWRAWRCKIWICFLACKPLIENITCNPHRGRKTERDGQEWEAYIDHHSLTHTDR